MNYYQPKSWAEFQHYKDRSPTWIKLHKSILDNYEYQCLPIASKALAPMLWLLASEYEEGKIPIDHNRIAFRVRLSVQDLEDALSPLIKSGFFLCYRDDSVALAECLPREEKRREYKAEKKRPKAPLALTRFAEFWQAYPRRADKAKAEQSWSKQGLDAIANEVIAGAVSYAKAKVGSEPQYIALPSTWLNGKRWQDEPAGAPVAAAPELTDEQKADNIRRQQAEDRAYRQAHDERLRKLNQDIAGLAEGMRP
jgi:hypothetical protein